MEYSKNEIREAKKRIAHELKIIEGRLPDIDNSWMASALILRSLVALKHVLGPIKTHIIDIDDYPLAVELNAMIAPVWNQYCNSAKDDESLKHQEAYDLQDIISDLREWLGEYEAAHPKQPDTPTSTPSAKEDNLSYITNDKILKALPDLYDCLVDDGVVDANAISKADFMSKIAKGDIPRLKQGESEWVKKITKFKGGIKCIKHCFDDKWYIAVCNSAGLTDKEIGKYNTDNSADFETTIKTKLKQNGIK